MRPYAVIFVAGLAQGCSADASPSHAAPAEKERTVSWHVCVKEFFAGTPWPGARLAVYDRDDIAPAETDELGCATLRALPANTELPIGITASGLTPMIYTLVTGDSDSVEGHLDEPAAEWRRIAANVFGFQLDSSMGSFTTWVTKSVTPAISALNGIAGVTPHLLDSPSAEGPFFNEGATKWASPDTLSTTDTGLAIYFNVGRGKTEVELELPPGLECVLGYDEQWGIGFSWPAQDSPRQGTIRLRVPIYPGYYTGSGVRCGP